MRFFFHLFLISTSVSCWLWRLQLAARSGFFFPSETEQKRNLTSKTQKATTGTKAVPVSLLFLCGCKYNFESYTGSLWIFLRLGVYGAHFCVRLPTSCRQEPLYCSLLLPSFSSSLLFSWIPDTFQVFPCPAVRPSCQSVVARLVECFQPFAGSSVIIGQETIRKTKLDFKNGLGRLDWCNHHMWWRRFDLRQTAVAIFWLFDCEECLLLLTGTWWYLLIVK